MNIYLLITLSLTSLFVNAQIKSASTRFDTGKLAISVYGDQQIEDFQWSIAGNSAGQNPNILSEVIWKNSKSRGIGADVSIGLCSGIFVKAQYHKSFIYAGTASDKDYAQDNRSNPTYQAELSSNEGSAYRFTAALGYRLKTTSNLLLMPYAGYTRSRQFLHLKAFEQPAGPGLKALNSTYQTNWTGALAGIDATFLFSQTISASALLNYKQLNYSANANWNLIDAFAHPVSFKHTAKGFETNAAVVFNIQLSLGIAALIRADYSYAETGTGTDQLFLIDGQQPVSRFNGAKRTVKGIGIGINIGL